MRSIEHRDRAGHVIAFTASPTRATTPGLGHRSITSTAVYTALAPNRFKDYWRD
jgi:hypothetical protein